MNPLNDCHEVLVSSWLNEMKTKKANYSEPILNETTMDKIKMFCDTLQQDSHVFLMTVELVEQYIYINSHKKTNVQDPFLLIITSIYLSSKHIGEISEFKPGNLILLYEKLTYKKLTNRTIKLMEMDILAVLDYKLPLYTRIDDLKTFLQYYMSPFKLKFDMTYLCEELLNFFTIHSLILFTTLKIQYLQNIEAYNAFWYIYTNRLYLPIGILICAFKMTKITNVINTVDVVKELSSLSNIHSDHLYFLSDEIYKLWVRQKKHNKIKA